MSHTRLHTKYISYSSLNILDSDITYILFHTLAQNLYTPLSFCNGGRLWKRTIKQPKAETNGKGWNEAQRLELNRGKFCCLWNNNKRRQFQWRCDCGVPLICPSSTWLPLLIFVVKVMLLLLLGLFILLLLWLSLLRTAKGSSSWKRWSSSRSQHKQKPRVTSHHFLQPFCVLPLILLLFLLWVSFLLLIWLCCC